MKECGMSDVLHNKMLVPFTEASLIYRYNASPNLRSYLRYIYTPERKQRNYIFIMSVRNRM